jgi:hypothetical protein
MYVIYIPGHNSGTPRAISTKLGTHIAICMLYIFPGITLERLERFRPNLVHTLLYVCVRILCIYSAGRMVWEAGNLDDSHCRGNQIIAVAR